jgi:type I restriction enzyme S subunit
MEVREASAGYGGLTALPNDVASFGCRKAEAGIFPDDWISRSINELAAKHSNAIVGGPFGSDLVSKDYVPVGVPVIRGQNMSRHYVAGDFVFVSTAKARRLQANLARPDDIVFTQRGTLGQVALVPFGPFDEYVVSQSQMKLTLRSDAASAEYVYQYFTSEAGQKQILESAIQTGVPHTNLGILRCYQVPLPPTIAEQEAIAEALSDADALIESLEQLIAKKRQIKQGTMQALLTGKQRLPGFSEDWVVRSLSDLASIRSGGTPSTAQAQFWDGDILWCTPTDITALNGRKYLSDTVRKITRQGFQSSSAELIEANSIVMTSRATIGECAINVLPVATNQGFKNFIPFDDVDVEFFYYLLLTQKEGFIRLCAGSTFLEIGKTQLASFEVLMPTTTVEQVAIATILTDMDNELAELETRLAKTRQLKQGTMQELLTGRIRLV